MIKTGLSGYNIACTTSKTAINTIIKQCQETFKEPINERENYAELLNKFSTSANFLYAFNERIIGYIAFYANNLTNREAYISLIAVKPEYQHLYVGTNLLKECIEIAKSKDMKSLLLEVKKNNKEAISFYQANGFYQKRNKNEESYIFSKTLIK